jgi:D-sedoheptulose 7-phosphate isomerase
MSFVNIIQELKDVAREFSREGLDAFEDLVRQICDCLKSGHKILVFGNGGSAAQAQHFAAEIVNKFLKERRPLPALALTTDSSILTSVANDIGFEKVFSNQIVALGEKGDIALGLTTSGTSPNILDAFETAGQLGLTRAALTGKGGEKIADSVDHLLAVPSSSTPRIQEFHLVLLHLFAEEIEKRLF